jgi:hypothetical protein
MSLRSRVVDLLAVLLILPWAVLAACADDPTGPRAGMLTMGADEGLDFVAGSVRSPGNFQNSDLYASANGDLGLKLMTGGADPTKNRPILWFKGAGGLPTTFDAFDDVPNTPAADTDTEQLTHAKTHYGFVLETHTGTQVKGWITVADKDSVTIQFGPLAATE